MWKDPEIVWTNPYPNNILNFLDSFAYALTLPGIRVLDLLVSCFIFPISEAKQIYIRLLYYFGFAPILLITLVFTVPAYIIGFLILLPVQYFRQPYRYSYIKGAPSVLEDLLLTKNKFRFATINTCLLPESLCRFNNLTNNTERAKEIGARIIEQQGKIHTTQSNEHPSDFINHRHGNGHCGDRIGLIGSSDTGTESHIQNSMSSGADEDASFDHTVCTEFLSLDFVLFQEMFDRECAVIMVKKMHQFYPHIIHDVRLDSWSSNRFAFNSGLMLASRYPFLSVDFNWYTTSCNQCTLNSKGLLQAKVDLGKNQHGKKVVGYVAVTHLQAYQGNTPVHEAQLDDINTWVDQFREKTLLSDEVVAFDILGGDFNLDNMSPVDRMNWNHPIFSIYHDVGRVKPGLNHSWTVGTEMRHVPLHDELVSTPEGLKYVLNHPSLLEHYIISADIENSSYKMSTSMPSTRKSDQSEVPFVGGRRCIDLVLYRKGDDVRVLKYNPVTQLAGLTDHIPIVLTIMYDNIAK